MHRDLKPSNIMLGGVPANLYDREVAQQYGTAKIADFGLSKSLALRNAASSHSHRHVNQVYRLRSWACTRFHGTCCSGLGVGANRCTPPLDSEAPNDAACGTVA